ncbi:MAG: hypothetical protein JOZ62_06445, partial [Acidobacteriaceae bacterium]|nr:hypothetical protein [Acidobacteriaceae bacterium]
MTEIDREHPEFKRQKRMWQMYRDLYAGGEQFKHRAAEYLLRRQKEPLDVYGERLQRAFYQNYIGSIVDWYAATLFRRAPSLQFDSGLETGRKFLAEFADDCDRRGTNLAAFFKVCLINALVCGRSHILIDFPRTGERPANRAEEDAAGMSRAYLVRYEAEDLINWSVDERGDYEWVVLRHSVTKQPSVDSTELVSETYWFYYDKEEFRTYRRIEKEHQTQQPELIARGPHCLMRQRRVPLLTLKVSEGLWL